ncbi:MAG: SusC/RagA family TonB-linked outer membrane protein [Chitinophagaceae bacterium]|nr:SusC/RagA family TonB-linked outer membrane protein [Chitinophagaceae bacterium]
MRGSSGIPDLQASYQNAPNLPLFILDGFETTVQRIYDLNMELVERVTVLKDASAKAIYGSKAGNGVIVVETKRPSAGALRVGYNGGITISAPDLTSYNLANAQEKLDAEVLAGVYRNNVPNRQFPLIATYGQIQKDIASGVNTDWLAQPVQNGIGQRHNVTLDGGGEGMRYFVSLNYNKITGTMKGSDRTTATGVVNLEYRKNKFAFRNNLSIDNNKGINSPYGSFTQYARMNPYWRIHDDNGELIKSYHSGNTPNPLYNLQFKTKDFSTYTTITENFYAEWTPVKSLRFTARTGLSLSNSGTEFFIPAQHTRYATILPTSDQYLKRGEYTITNGKSNMFSTDLGASYSVEKNGHQVFTNLIYSIQQTSNAMTGMSMVGFPNDRMDDISMGLEYKEGTTAQGSEQTSRTVGVTSAINYSYLNKYLADFSYRASGSSQFGADNRWGSFWSAGAGWNVHNEAFAKGIKNLNQLRIRGSIGSTGTQNFSAYQAIATYNYITSQAYDGELGNVLMALHNPNLKWQEIFDKNIGADITLFNKLTIRFDLYSKITKSLLSDQTTAPSTGFNVYRENIGETVNKGYEVGLSYKVISNSARRTYVTVFANAAHNENRIRKVSDALKSLNEAQDSRLLGNSADASRPVTRFQEGQSLTSIWAVTSLGIDPITGSEIFLTRDGNITHIWNVDDQVVAGDMLPSLNGTFGVNARIKGWSFNIAMMFQFGAQIYNTTLVQKVENASMDFNVDRRFLLERWNTPGQYSLFKNIADRTVTKPTTRFVQDNDEMILSSITAAYDFGASNMMKRIGLKNFRVNMTLNDLVRVGKIRAERGTLYPFARNFLMGLQFNF